MRVRYLLPIVLVCALQAVWAAPYGHYDFRQVAVIGQKPPASGQGRQVVLNLGYLDRMSNDLAAHAFMYPPRFDSDADKQRARKDAEALSGLLEIISKPQALDARIHYPAALVNAVAYNFNLPGADARARAHFEAALSTRPGDARVRLHYGNFLFGSSHIEESIPQFRKAFDGGEIDAAFWLGTAYVSLGKKTEALRYWDHFVARSPNGLRIKSQVEALRRGELKVEAERRIAP